MFARNVSIRLKPNTVNDFTQTFEKDVLPMLRKEAGFRDEIATVSDDGIRVTAISLWDSKDQAELYSRNTYPTVLKSFEKFIDGPPTVHTSKVINSTSHKLTAAAVVAA
jgi:quinol monooxygenase YgiN